MHAKQKSGDEAQREPQYLPATQLVQTEEPAASAKVPASQGRHVAIDVASMVGE